MTFHDPSCANANEPSLSFVPLSCPPASGGGGPVTLTACAAPGLTSIPACLADCTPIAILFEVLPAPCGSPAPAPVLLGWTNLTTGVFTAGNPPAGVKDCSDCDQCLDCEVVELCDVGVGSNVLQTTVVNEDASYISSFLTTQEALAGTINGTPLWNGGTIIFPQTADLANDSTFTGTSAVLGATVPCGDLTGATVDITASVRLTVLGPNPALAGWVVLGVVLNHNTLQPPLGIDPGGQAVGVPITISTGPINVSYADILAGNVSIALWVEGNDDNGPKSVQADQFTLTMTSPDGDFSGCGPSTPFVRTICRDCDGNVVSIVDTEADLVTPYIITGTVTTDCDIRVVCDDCEIIELCDGVCEAGEQVTNGNFPTDLSGWITSGNVIWAADNGPDGVPGIAEFNALVGPPDGVIEQFIVVTPGSTYDFDARVGVNAFSTGIATQRALVEVLDGSGNVLFSKLIVPPFIATTGMNWPLEGVISERVAATDNIIHIRVTDQSDTPHPNVNLAVDSISLNCVCVNSTPTPFLRRICTNCDGVIVSVTDTGLDGFTPYVTTGNVGTCGNVEVCDIPPPASFLIERCGCDDTDGDGVVDQIYVEFFQFENGVPVSVGTFDPNMQPYTPVDPIECPANSIHFAEFILCDDNGPFLRKYLQDDGGNVLVVINLTLDGTLYVPQGTVTVCNPSSAENISSTVNRQTGAGVVNIPAGARSVTFASLTGNPTVSISAGPAVAIPAGSSLTWSGTDLTDSFTFTGLAGDDFIVTTVRAI